MQQQKILLLTGWGTCCQAWDRIIPVLQQRYQVNCVSPPWVIGDLDGYTLKEFDAYVEWLAGDMQEAVTIVAWSFGGLLAIQLAARFPHLVTRLILISSSAKFIADEQSMGIDPNWFEKFQQDFSKRPVKVLQKFFALTNHGDEFAESTTKYLKQSCSPTQHNMDECAYALAQLGTLDLSEQLKQLSCPVDFIHGEYDAVLNIEAARCAAKQINSDLYTVKSAGHAPHVSHPSEVLEIITQVVPT